MKKTVLILVGAMLILCNVAVAQNTTKEIVKEGGVESEVTISEVSMYGGTKSEAAKGYFDQAAKYDGQKDFKNAKKYYLKAIKEDDQYVEAYDNLGLVYRRMGDYDKAIKYYKSSIGIFPNGELAHQNLAVVYGIQKKYDASIQEYEKIVEISPNNPEGYFGIASSNMMVSNFDEAIVNGEKALKIYEETNSPHLSDGYYLLGLINYYKGDVDSARKYMQLVKDQGVKIDPQLEKEVFGNATTQDAIVLETSEDYDKYEPKVLESYDWLMNTPLGKEEDKRKALNGFLIQWMSGSPNVSIELSEKLVTYLDCADCLIMYMGGWTKYAIDTKKYDDKYESALAGTQSVIQFYKANEETIGKIQSIEDLIKLDDNNELEDFVKKNL